MKPPKQLSPVGPLHELSYYEELWQDLDGASFEAQVVAYRQLAIQAFAAAEVQAQALSTDSRRAWQVARVECHCPRPFPLSDAARTKFLADKEAEQRKGVPSAVHRVSLLAHIQLTCTAAETP
jgi:hypothetical protein